MLGLFYKFSCSSKLKQIKLKAIVSIHPTEIWSWTAWTLEQSYTGKRRTCPFSHLRVLKKNTNALYSDSEYSCSQRRSWMWRLSQTCGKKAWRLKRAFRRVRGSIKQEGHIIGQRATERYSICAWRNWYRWSTITVVKDLHSQSQPKNLLKMIQGPTGNLSRCLFFFFFLFL